MHTRIQLFTHTVVSLCCPSEESTSTLRATPLSSRLRQPGAGLRWSSVGPRLGAEPPHASAAADRAADETCWPRRAPVTGRSPARATLIFDLFDGTRASWRAFVVDGSAAGVLEPRRSCWCSPQHLPRPHARWSQAVAGGRRMPLPRQSPWSSAAPKLLASAAAARSTSGTCGSRCEPVGRGCLASPAHEMARYPLYVIESVRHCESPVCALAQFYVSGRASVTHWHNYTCTPYHAATHGPYVLCDWASTGHPLECAAAAHAPAGAAEGRSQPRERLEAWQLAARESHRSSRPGLTRRGPSWRWHSSAACRAADLGAAAERRLQPHGHCCCSSRCRRARPRTTSTRRRPCCERLAPGALPA